VEGPISGLCPVTVFDVRGLECLGSHTKELVINSINGNSCLQCLDI
jgi:hypothetical protein